MSDWSMHAGGAAWLDAMLYDGALSNADPLLGDDGLRRRPQTPPSHPRTAALRWGAQSATDGDPGAVPQAA